MEVFGIITSFKCCEEIYIPDNSLRNGDYYSVHGHIRKIGDRNLVVYFSAQEVDSNDNVFISKYKAKNIKGRWRLQIKSGVELIFNARDMSKQIEECMAEVILLG